MYAISSNFSKYFHILIAPIKEEDSEGLEISKRQVIINPVERAAYNGMGGNQR